MLKKHKNIYLFQPLDVICYARRGPIGAESKEQGDVAPRIF